MAVKLTSFGRMTRKFRVEWDERLVDMANHLGVTGGFLSSVECGRRNAPIEWIDVLTIKNMV